MSPITTFLINHFHLLKASLLLPLLAIITQPIMIIIREVTRMSESIMFIKAFSRNGKAVVWVTLVESAHFEVVLPISIHLPIKGTFVLRIIHHLALQPHSSSDLPSVTRQDIYAFSHFSFPSQFMEEQASDTLFI